MIFKGYSTTQNEYMLSHSELSLELSLYVCKNLKKLIFEQMTMFFSIIPIYYYSCTFALNDVCWLSFPLSLKY